MPFADRLPAAVTNNFPGLRILANPASLSKYTRQKTGYKGETLAFEPYYVRLKGQSSCLVGYRVSTDETQTYAYAKVFDPINATKLDKISSRQTTDSPLGTGRIVDPKLLLSLSFYPNDKALKGLTHYLHKFPHIQRLAYKPERRFVGLLNEADSNAQVVKIYKPSGFRHAVDMAQAAGAIGMMPKVAKVNHRRSALHLDWMEGTPLTEHLLNDAADPIHLVHACGGQLAEFHATAAPAGLPVIGIRRLQERTQQIAADLKLIRPESATVIDRVSLQLTQSLCEAPSAVGLTHGDFYANQVLVASDGIRLLDFDELCIAPQAADIGLFRAHLEYDHLRGRMTQSLVARATERFCEGYTECKMLDTRAATAYTAYGMFQLAHRPFRDLLPEWPEKIDAWLEMIARYLRVGGEVHKRVLTSGSDAQRSAAFASEVGALKAALDPATGGAAVVNAAQTALQRAWSIDHASIRIIAHKPGRRAVLRYALTPKEGGPEFALFAKIRAKGLDRRTFELCSALRAASESLRSRYLDIPEPVACVDELAMWLQREAPGVDGWRALAAPSPTRSVHAIASALAEFHRLDVLPKRDHTIADEVAILEERLNRFASSRPNNAKRVSCVLTKCGALAESLHGRPVTLIHRDFYPSQVVLDGDRVSLLDLDLVSRGDSALDVGNFVAHIQELDLRTRCDPYARKELTDAFIDAYCAAADEEAHGLRRAIEAYRVLTLARHIDISANHPERKGFSFQILACVEHAIAHRSKRHHQIAYS